MSDLEDPRVGDAPLRPPPLRVRALGVVIEVEVPDVATRDRLAGQWVRALDDGHDAAASSVVAIAGTPETEAARDYQLTTMVTRAALTATSGERLNLHAGGVADPDGRTLVVLGRSGMGKTTAIRALAARLGYVSDETISLDDERRIAPHPKPLSVVVEGGMPTDKDQLSPDDLGLVVPPPDCRLARFVVLQRDPDGPDSGLVRLPLVDAMMEVIPQTSSLSRMASPLLDLAALETACGGFWALRYTEIAHHLDDLFDFLADAAPLSATDPAPEVLSHPPPGDAVQPHDDHRLRWRTAYVDAIEVDGDVVVLVDEEAYLLEGLAATVWAGLAEPATVAELTERAQSAHGDHPEAATLVAEAVQELVQRELVGTPISRESRPNDSQAPPE